jgi:hypothetical protein
VVLGRAEDWNEWIRRVESECGWDEHEQPLKRGAPVQLKTGGTQSWRFLRGGS